MGRLLAPYPARWRKRHIQDLAEPKLQERLQQSDGFDRYGEIQQGLKHDCGIEVSYAVVHLPVRYRLKAKLKGLRPVSVEQQPGSAGDLQKPWLLV